MSRIKLMTAGAVIAAVAVIVYLALFDPTSSPSPRCVFKALTGYECPGCGTQRAIHALFSGRFVEAWSFNPALFFAIPLAAAYMVCPRQPGGTFYNIMYSRVTLWLIVAAIAGWWILRNMF